MYVSISQSKYVKSEQILCVQIRSGYMYVVHQIILIKNPIQTRQV